ncbi:hypothetical protein [Actinoplanes derwentensis]|uniref:Uncharacterized protein n=1 Tax=Actinoplanes derwentensis TaxID=113562 RepID=A0A1H2CUZ1_9ACTN|nr:hypothetical protein [Actinoplanes derwentensis]GID81956.1 hypothetical protein Ade03nite_08800 [Actinoplanes derwentensis]SDT74194.1 hypothetical protein SAMN04489716_6905 [Actinoplanes derwentensis]
MPLARAATGYTLQLTTFPHAVGRPAVKPGGWPTKKAALTALGRMRERGLNCDPIIEVNRVITPLQQVWAVTFPDHYEVTTALMTRAGTWLRGRITDATPCYCEPRCKGGHPAPWTLLTPHPAPATFTHVTRTVLDPARQERYRAKSNGSCGRWITPDQSIALCTCGWKAYENTRSDAQAAARVHRTIAASPAPAAA